MDYSPTNLTISQETLAQARKLIAADEDVIIRYLRKDRTVHYAKVPVRDEHGAIIVEDGKWLTKSKLVICSGVPTAALVAVNLDDTLLIGWSRRMDSKVMLETKDLHTMFTNIVKNLQKPMGDYDASFNQFCNMLVETMSRPVKDVEVGFSKKAGKEAAVLRALTDTILTVNNRYESAASGPIPNEVVRGLKWFIPQAEEAFGMSATNVAPHADFAMTTTAGTAVATV